MIPDSDSTDVPAADCQILHTLGGKAIIWSCRRRSTRVSPYNALGNAAATASQLLQHSSELQLPQATPSAPPLPPLPPPVSLALNEMNFSL